MMCKWLIAAALGCLYPVLHGAEIDAQMLQHRHELIEMVESKGAEALPALIDALADERQPLRLTAAHLLARLGEAGRPGFEAALKSEHTEVRLAVLKGLARQGLIDRYWPEILLDLDPVVSRYAQLVLMKEHALPEGAELERLIGRMEAMIQQGAPAQRRHVLNVIASLEEMPTAPRRLLKLATNDEEMDIRRGAYQVVLDHITADWPEAPDLLAAALADPAKEVREIGQEMRWKLLEVKQMRLPRNGWRFRIDPDDVGRKDAWYMPEFDDSAWRDDVPIESSWKEHMKEVYNGVGWYRRGINVPGAPDGDRVYLHFEAVDEEAWVWVNGTFVGEHAMGREGWNIPFVLDITEAVKLGESNHVAVRAKNTSGGAGIWRPVRLRILNTNALQAR